MLSSTFVDEAHYFKNLFYVSKMTRIAGLPQSASERAFDMFLKVAHIQRVNGGGGVVFATGTPIANSVAEMFIMHDEQLRDAVGDGRARGEDHTTASINSLDMRNFQEHIEGSFGS